MKRLYLIAFALLAALQTGPAIADFGYGDSEDGFDGPTRVKISPNGDALLISTTLTAIDTVHLNHEAIIYYDLKTNAVRWVKGGCSQGWEGGRFSPDENLLAATIRYVSYKSYGSVTAVGRRFKLVLLDKDGHETVAVDETDNLLGYVTFVNTNQIVYHKNTQEDRTDKYYLYDISKKTIQLLKFKNPDGSDFDNSLVNHLGTMDGDKITFEIKAKSVDSLKVVTLSDLTLKPLPLITAYREGRLKGSSEANLAILKCVSAVFQTGSELLFKGCPVKFESYFASVYKYNPEDNVITHLFNSPGKSGLIANLDVARNTGAVAYVLYVPGGGQSIFIRDGDYQTPRRVKINLGAYKNMLTCGRH